MDDVQSGKGSRPGLRVGVIAEHLRAIAAELGMAGVAGWATALRAARLRSASLNGPGRPELDDPAARAAAASAVNEFVAGLQDGIDGGSSDVYDRQFASDVLWGNPYGGTLSGYQP